MSCLTLYPSRLFASFFNAVSFLMTNRYTNSVLTAALRNLESWGLITRKQYSEIPLRVEYSPTKKGKSLLPVCYEIIKWGSENSL
ncbi:MAG TPA: helix-turn-helix transcriptional regulator [Candidatus Faeciplasma gallinarum]|uniref:Helix-turn-helix transcriptional regulator n=1 Tax=Candidatus Faeciplasma gallinarum TaxID=2840799 RepID=A0A9D1JHQ3_9FIRM|nr:helix-turn-helix transcriptional regulator [Candidatus Faeciplasma gallinarum]